MKNILLIWLITLSITASGQFYVEERYTHLTELENNLSKAKTDKEKTSALIALFMHHSAHNETLNRKASKEYREKMEVFAHKINNPEIIARTLHAITIVATNEELKKAADNLREYSNLHNLDYYSAQALLREAVYFYSYKKNYDKGTQLINEAVSIGKELDDSLQAVILISSAYGYGGVNQYLYALNAASKAQELAIKNKLSYLLAFSYAATSNTYRLLKDYNKAIEYSKKFFNQLQLLNKDVYTAFEHANLSRNFFYAGQPLLGSYHMKQAYRVADSIKGSKRLYNNITGTIVAALSNMDYNDNLKELITKYRQHFFIFPGSEFTDYVTLGRAHCKLGNLDSAKWMVNKAYDYLDKGNTTNISKAYYHTKGLIASADKDWNSALHNYKQCFDIALIQNNLAECVEMVDTLKNIAKRQNNMVAALEFYRLKDSLLTELSIQFSKEELVKQEVNAFEKQKELLTLEREKEKKQRHNVQYLGITTGVIGLFIALVLMGMMSVSVRTIKVLNFFTFLLFFEFVFLVFKKQIYVITGGEPWKDLAFMVLLAAIMVPLHHWGEHKVVAYLTTKKLQPSHLKFWKTRKIIKEEQVN